MFDFKVRGRGNVSVDELDNFVGKLAEVLNSRFEDLENYVLAQDAKIKRLQSELDAERRLRLGARK